MNGKENIILVCFYGFIFVAGIFIHYLAASYSCSKKAVSFEDSYYGLFEGCMVLHNDKWLPLENIRGFD